MSETERTKMYEELNLRLIHVGINFDNDAQASEAADLFCKMLNLNKKPVPGMSYFAGDCVELMNNRNRGSKGHIGFATNDLDKTEALMEEMGFKVDKDSYFFLPNGKKVLVYLEDEYYGFAVHFTERI